MTMTSFTGPLVINVPASGDWIQFQVNGVPVGSLSAHVCSTGEVQFQFRNAHGPYMVAGHRDAGRAGYIQFTNTPKEAPGHHLEAFSLTSPGTYGDMFLRGNLTLADYGMVFNTDGSLKIPADPSGGINIGRPRAGENASNIRFWTANRDDSNVHETARIGLQADGKPMFNSGATDSPDWLKA